MSATTLLTLLAALATVAMGIDTYSGLEDAQAGVAANSGVVVISSKFSKDGELRENPLPAPLSANNCGEQMVDSSCLVQLSWDNRDFIEVTVDTPASGPSIAPDMGPVSKIVLKRCYSVNSFTNRKWRKFKDPIKKDNSCKNAGSTTEIDFSSPTVFQYNLPSDIPTGTYYWRVLFQCDDEQWCGFTEGRVDGGTGEARAHWQANVMDQVSTGLTIGVIICAICAPLILIGYFVYEQSTKKSQ